MLSITTRRGLLGLILAASFAVGGNVYAAELCCQCSPTGSLPGARICVNVVTVEATDCSSADAALRAQMGLTESYSCTFTVGPDYCQAGSPVCDSMSPTIVTLVEQEAAEEAPEGEDVATPGETAAAGAPITLPDPLGGVSVPAFFGNVIRVFSGIAGAIALLMFVYGGIMWILSGGDQAKIKAAQKILMNATIGLILIFGAYLFTSAIVGSILASPST